MYLSVFLFKVLAFPTQIKYWIGQSPRADCSAWRYSIWDNPSASRSLMSCNLVLVWVKRVLLPAKFLVCLPHCCHSWASAKLAGGPLMDLTDCGFGADSDGFFWCGILMDCVREFTIQAIIARHLPDSPILQVGAFLHSIKSRDLRGLIYQKWSHGPTMEFYTGRSLISSGQEATISKAKTFCMQK